MKRRDMLSGGTAGLIAGLLTITVKSATPEKSEIAVLFDAWRDAEARFNVDGLEADDSPAFEEMSSLRALIVTLPTRSHSDLAQKLYAFTAGDVLENYASPCELAVEINHLALGGAA